MRVHVRVCIGYGVKEGYVERWCRGLVGWRGNRLSPNQEKMRLHLIEKEGS